MNLLQAPLWLQIALVAEALALAWLVGRFGWRGILWGLAAGVGFWFLLAASGTLLVSRLEGSGPAGAREILVGSVLATARLAQAGWPLLAAGAAAGAIVRWAVTGAKHPPR